MKKLINDNELVKARSHYRALLSIGFKISEQMPKAQTQGRTKMEIAVEYIKKSNS